METLSNWIEEAYDPEAAARFAAPRPKFNVTGTPSYRPFAPTAEERGSSKDEESVLPTLLTPATSEAADKIDAKGASESSVLILRSRVTSWSHPPPENAPLDSDLQ